MPTKNETTIEWGSGTLFFIPPEGGDPVAVGPVKGLTETREEEWLNDPELPCPLNMSINQMVSFEAEMETISLPKLWRLTGDPVLLVKWGKKFHPRLTHLVAWAKTKKARKKNYHRLVDMFLEEAFACL